MQSKKEEERVTVKVKRGSFPPEGFDKRTLKVLNDDFVKEVNQEVGGLYSELYPLENLKAEHRRTLLSIEINRLIYEQDPANAEYAKRLEQRFHDLYFPDYDNTHPEN